MRPSNWIIFMGVTLTLMGILALMFASATTLASVLFLGAVLFVAGVAEVIYGIQGRKSGQLWPHLGLGVLAIACSVLIARNPIENTLGLTLLVSFLLLASGLTKVIGAAAERFSGWGWVAVNGVISIALGTMILATFPVSAFRTLGTFVGVDLIVSGVTFIGMGVSMKQIRHELEETGQTWNERSRTMPGRSEHETEDRTSLHH